MKQTEKHSKVKHGDVCMVGVSLAFRVCSSSHSCMASADGDRKCLLHLELFPFSWKQLLLLESSFFSSLSPNEKFPLFRVHQNYIASKVALKLSAAVGPRNMLFLLSLLFWLGSFSPSFPAMNNVQFTLGAWQSSPLSTYGLGCLSPVISHASALARAHSWQEMYCFQPKAQLLLSVTSQGAAGVQSENIGTFYFRAQFCT